MNLKYVIYARKSQENKDRQALSIESQLKELREYARKEGLEVVRELQESQTAYKPGRLVFYQMLEMFEEGLVNGVLAWKPDRIARNALDGGKFIQSMDDGHVLELRTPYERFERADNRMMLYIHFGMSNDYSRQISANVKRGNREKYRRGEYVGKAPLGYLNVKVGNANNIAIDPEKGPLVKRLFEEFATGEYSVQDMVRYAREWGLKSLMGNEVAKSGMYILLRRKAYYGAFEHAGELHQGSYEPLVGKELFDRVQEVLENRQKPRKRTWEHEYVGLIRCGECGCSITATTKHKHYKGTNRDADYTYYHCTKRRGVCNQSWLVANELEEMLGGYLDKVVIDREVWELGVKLLKAKHGGEIEKQEMVRRSMQKELNGVERKLGKLLEMRLNEELTVEEYSRAKKGLLERKMELKEKLDDGDQSSLTWLERAESFFETAYRAREVFERGSVQQKRDLIRAVGWNLTLTDKKLDFSFRKPFDVLLEPSMRANVQAC